MNFRKKERKKERKKVNNINLLDRLDIYVKEKRKKGWSDEIFEKGIKC